MTGEIEIIAHRDGKSCFAVMVWDAHRDSGCLAGTFSTRRQAIEHAEAIAKAAAPRERAE